MKHNKQAMTIVLAIVLSIVMWVIAIYLIDYIIPFSKNIKGIENVARAYYQAQWWVEKSMYFIRDNFWTNSWKVFSSNSVDYQYDIIALWDLLPILSKWNSEFDNNFNRLKIGEPIQLKIWKWRLDSSDWNNVEFTIRVPDLDKNGSLDEDLTWDDNDFLVNWQLVSPNWVLNASWTQITYKDIEGWDIKNWVTIFDWSKQNSLWNYYYVWVDLDDEEDNFKNFYDDNCWGDNECILKLSVINEMKIKNWWNEILVPYLEWKIDLQDTWKEIPLRYTQIHSEWKSYWFKKEIDIRYPQQTVNEAFDFTVFQ